MSETIYEVVQIREIVREVGRFGGIMRLLYVAEKTTPEGTETIAMSTEVEWRKSEKPPEAELQDKARGLHTLVLQSLLRDGWEPIGTDVRGRVMALRRALPQGEPDQPVEADEFSWQYTHPWRN